MLVVVLALAVTITGCAAAGLVPADDGPLPGMHDGHLLFEGTLAGHAWAVEGLDSDHGAAVRMWRDEEPQNTTWGFGAPPDAQRPLQVSAGVEVNPNGERRLDLLLGFAYVEPSIDEVVIVRGSGVVATRHRPRMHPHTAWALTPIAVDRVSQEIFWAVACRDGVAVDSAVVWTDGDLNGAVADFDVC